MLNKNDIEILTALSNMLGDGYEVITLEDIAEFLKVDKASLGDLTETINTLNVEKYISLKYAKEGYFCLAVQALGRRKVEEMKAIPVAKLTDKTIIKTAEDGSNVIAVTSADMGDAKLAITSLLSDTDENNELAIIEPKHNKISQKFGVKAFFTGLIGGLIGGSIVATMYYVFDIVLALF